MVNDNDYTLTRISVVPMMTKTTMMKMKVAITTKTIMMTS